MSKVLTFSRTFPAYHPKAGQPTNFVEQIYNSIGMDFTNRRWIGMLNEINPDQKEILAGFVFGGIDYKVSGIKRHTIRSGNRWKVGDKISLRVWSGKPYQSKQIIIAPDIEVKKVWPVEIEFFGGSFYVQLPVKKNHWTLLSAGDVAKNDGLEVHDFIDWFKVHPKSKAFNFKGQIICWDESVIY